MVGMSQEVATSSYPLSPLAKGDSVFLAEARIPKTLCVVKGIR